MEPPLNITRLKLRANKGKGLTATHLGFILSIGIFNCSTQKANCDANASLIYRAQSSKKSLRKGEKAPYLVYINVLFFQPGLREDFGNGIDGRDTHMARFDADDGSAHKLGDDVVAFRLRARACRQDAQRRAVAHAAGVPSRGRRAAPFREGRLQRSEPLRAHVRPNGVVHGHDVPSELNGEDLPGKDAIC